MQLRLRVGPFESGVCVDVVRARADWGRPRSTQERQPTKCIAGVRVPPLCLRGHAQWPVQSAQRAGAGVSNGCAGRGEAAGRGCADGGPAHPPLASIDLGVRPIGCAGVRVDCAQGTALSRGRGRGGMGIQCTAGLGRGQWVGGVGALGVVAVRVGYGCGWGTTRGKEARALTACPRRAAASSAPNGVRERREGGFGRAAYAAGLLTPLREGLRPRRSRCAARARCCCGWRASGEPGRAA